MKRVFSLFAIVIAFMFLESCGDVGDADIGNTVIVTASVEKNYVEQDIITTIDGTCDYRPDNSVIPPVATNNITINVSPISQTIGNPSPVSVTTIEISYIPTNGAPNINKFTIRDTKTIQPNNSLTFSIPVIDSPTLQNFSLDFLGGINVNYTYYVDVKVKLKEIYTNKDLEKQVRFTLSLKNVINNNECNNTNTNTTGNL